MKKLKALNIRGFSHEIVLVAVVLVVAVGGTYWLVASHADSCSGVSDPASVVSDPTSSPNCTPVSSVSSPVSSANVTKGSCYITGVPATVTASSVFTIRVTTRNLGTSTWQPTVTGVLSLNNGFLANLNAPAQPFLPAPTGTAVSKVTFVLGSSKGLSTTGATSGSVTATSTSPKFSCNKQFTVQ